jgi:hypothetical protein
MSIFQHHAFRRFRTLAFNAPRRPRHPLLRLALGMIGIALLLVLVVVGVFVGAAMLAGGMLWRLWARRGKPAVRRGSIDGDYHVVGKAQLPLAR